MPTLRCHGAKWVTSSPPMRILPPGTGPKPAMARSNVDLPDPEGPRKVKNSPGSMVKLTPFSTWVVPKERLTPSMVTPTASGLISVMA